MSEGSYKLFCLENPLLDIQAKGDEALLQKYGLKSNDAILAEEKHLPIYEELLSSPDVKLIPGGAAQNTARGAQYILPPNSVVYTGSIGRDKYADILIEAVKKAGLRTEYMQVDDVPTGRCGVVISGHDRCLCTDLAAANKFQLSHLKSERVWPLVENAEVCYVGGYHLTVCPEAALALAEQQAETGKIFALCLSAPFIPIVFKDQLDQTAEHWDYLIGNETEAASYAESHGWGKLSVKEIAQRIADLPKKNDKRPRTVIITQGTDPTIAAIQGQSTPREIPVHAIEKDQICDTNGAGDAFAGGFLAGIIEGKPLGTCIDMGHWLARLSIQELGPSFPFPVQKYGA